MDDVHLAITEGLLEYWVGLPLTLITNNEEGELEMTAKEQAAKLVEDNKPTIRERIVGRYRQWKNNRALGKKNETIEKAKVGIKKAATKVWAVTKKVAYAAYKVARLLLKTAILAVIVVSLMHLASAVIEVAGAVVATVAMIVMFTMVISVVSELVVDWFDKDDIRLVA